MRKRWRSRFGTGDQIFDDDPTDIPVSFGNAEASSDEEPSGMPEPNFDDFPADDFDEEHPDSLHSWEKLPSEDVERHTFPPVPPLAGDLLEVPDGDIRIVDKGSLPSSSTSDRFEPLTATAPPVIVSEAIRLTEKKPVLFPWEKGRLSRIFGDQGRLSLKQPRLGPGMNNFVNVGVGVSDGFRLDGTITIEPVADDSAIYMSVVKQIVGCPYAEERASQREHAMHEWWDLLRLNLAASDPGKTAVAEHGVSSVFSYGVEILDAIFALKSPKTLLKRLCAIKLYNQWLIRNYTEVWIPFVEHRVWAYMRELREKKAPASRAGSLLESIRFCHYTMRIEGALAVLESLRLKGLAAQLYATKRPWRPSDVLTLSDVEFLHQCFSDKSRSSIDRIFIGHALHLLYGRARFSELLAITECFLDEDWAFLEVSAALHKGARSMDSKSKLLPIVAPARGVYGSNWAKEYLELRHSSGLAEPGDKPGPMLPAPIRGGQGWSDRYVTSQEFNRFLQALCTWWTPNCGAKYHDPLYEGYGPVMVLQDGSFSGESSCIGSSCHQRSGCNCAVLEGFDLERNACLCGGFGGHQRTAFLPRQNALWNDHSCSYDTSRCSDYSIATRGFSCARLHAGAEGSDGHARLEQSWGKCGTGWFPILASY